MKVNGSVSSWRLEVGRRKESKKNVPTRWKIEPVELLDVDNLAFISLEQLSELHRQLHGVMSDRKKRFLPSVDVEVELCYIQREFEIRMRRSEAHALWLSNGCV